MKKIFSLILLLIPLLGLSQSDSSKQYIHKKLLRSCGGISPGIMTKQKITNIYLVGNLEFYVNRKISLRGESYYFIHTIDDTALFAFNHKTFAGAIYHFPTKNHLDPYVGISPGIAITKSKYGGYCPPGTNCIQGFVGPTYSKVAANPLMSADFGINYYFQRWFHFYADVRYNYGKHLSDAPPESLSEFNFTFGLGWNIF